MTRLSTLLLAATAAVGFGSMANAAPITTAAQTLTFGPAATEFTSADALSFNLFDPSLGTLTSITITGTYGFTSTITVTNSAATASSGSVKTESASQFNGTGAGINSVVQSLLDNQGTAIIGGTTLSPVAFDLTGSTQAYSLASGGTTQVTSAKTTQTDGPLTDSTAADLAYFIAGGANGTTGTVNLITDTGTLLSNTGGNTSASQATQATGSFSIAYTYNTPPPPTVPEPASMVILASGLIGTGLVRFRRK